MKYTKTISAGEAINMTEINIERISIIEDLMNEIFASIENACKNGGAQFACILTSEQDDQSIVDCCKEELNNLGFRVEHDEVNSELKIAWCNE